MELWVVFFFYTFSPKRRLIVRNGGLISLELWIHSLVALVLQPGGGSWVQAALGEDGAQQDLHRCYFALFHRSSTLSSCQTTYLFPAGSDGSQRKSDVTVPAGATGSHWTPS